MDPIVAFLILGSGIALLTSRKQQTAAREASVARGELSPAQATKIYKLLNWIIYCMIGCGVLLTLIWAAKL
ncbi:MAG: hypothetical protein JSS11_17370 [Verrucomicrobia bacterium]|nr:hypothetical protein [Verrucomicrobiota bacterium]